MSDEPNDFKDLYFEQRLQTEEQRHAMHRLDYNWVRAKLGKNLSKRLTVLDIGCSDGHFLNQFPQKNFNLFGIEPNKKQAEISQRLGIQIIQPVTSFENFDIVIIRGTLHHLPNSNNFLDELSHSFSNLDRAKYFFALANPNSESFLFKSFGTLPALEKSPTFESIFKVWGGKELANLLESKGAQVDLCYPYFRSPYKKIFSDFPNLWISLISNSYRNFAFPRNMFNLAAKFPATKPIN